MRQGFEHNATLPPCSGGGRFSSLRANASRARRLAPSKPRATVRHISGKPRARGTGLFCTTRSRAQAQLRCSRHATPEGAGAGLWDGQAALLCRAEERGREDVISLFARFACPC